MNATTESFEKLQPFASVIASFSWDPRTLIQPPGTHPALFKSLKFFFIPSFRLHATHQDRLDLKIHRLWETNFPIDPPKIRWEDIEPLLRTFPCSETLFLLRDALKIGAIINFKGERMKFHPCTPSKSFFQNSTPELRAKDFRAGFRTKDFPFSEIADLPFPNMWLCRVYAVLKKMSRKPRMVQHHSRNGPESINFWSCRFRQDVWYMFASATQILKRLGPFTLMKQYDIVSAYKMISVALQDLHLLGEAIPTDPDNPGVLGATAFSTRLNFGGRTSYDIFQALAQAFEHIIRSAARRHSPNSVTIRYADNSMTFIPPLFDSSGNPTLDTRTAQLIASDVNAAFAQAKLPVHEFDATPHSAWIGHVLDSTKMAAILTKERRAFIIVLLKKWLHDMPTCTLTEIQSLYGTLRHAAEVTPAAMVFLMRIHNFLRVVSKLDARTPGCRPRVPPSVRLDCDWHLTLYQSKHYSGINLLLDQQWTDAAKLGLTLSAGTDACLLAEGFCFEGLFAYRPWSTRTLQRAWAINAFSLPFLEGLTVVDCMATIGPRLSGRKLILSCDSLTFVDAFTTQKTTCPLIAILIRALHHIAVIYNFQLKLIHIAGVLNIGPDLLSRLKIKEFKNLHPTWTEIPILPWPYPPQWPKLSTSLPPAFYQALGNIMKRLASTGSATAEPSSSTPSKA